MDQTHIHLMITHLPIVGSVLGAIVLTYGLWTKSIHAQISAYILFLISSIGAIVSYLTGEAAEKTVENIGGISKNLVEQHEEFALIALTALVILGIMSFIALILTLKKSSFILIAALATLSISIISFGLIAWTGYLGGRIRHTEINTPAVSGIRKMTLSITGTSTEILFVNHVKNNSLKRNDIQFLQLQIAPVLYLHNI